jgi:hypothetical protein
MGVLLQAAVLGMLLSLQCVRPWQSAGRFLARVARARSGGVRNPRGTCRTRCWGMDTHKDRVYGIHDQCNSPSLNVTRGVHNTKQAACELGGGVVPKTLGPCADTFLFWLL